jgi:hypothetical protein
MGIRNRLLRSGALLVFLLSLSTSVSAIPTFQLDFARIADENAYDMEQAGVTKSAAQVDDMPVSGNFVLWGWHAGTNALLMGNEFGGRHRVHSAYGTPFTHLDVARLSTFGFIGDDTTDITQVIELSDDKNGISEFFTTLDVAAIPWQGAEEHSGAIIQHSTPGTIPAVAHRSSQGVCLQGHYKQPYKPGLRETDCSTGGGLAGSGAGGGTRSNNRSSVAASSGGKAGTGSGSGSGAGMGSGSGNGGAPGAAEGGAPGSGTGWSGDNAGSGGGDVGFSDGFGGDVDGGDIGGGPGLGNGRGDAGDTWIGENGGTGAWSEEGVAPGKIGTVPEPATFTLLVLGLAGMHAVRRSGRKQTKGYAPGSSST